MFFRLVFLHENRWQRFRLSSFLIGTGISATPLEIGRKRVNCTETVRSEERRVHKRAISQNQFCCQASHPSSCSHAASATAGHGKQPILRSHRTDDEHCVRNVARRSCHIMCNRQVIDIMQIRLQQRRTFIQHSPFRLPVKVEVFQLVG